jgi:di/tricarboxylate transporter
VPLDAWLTLAVVVVTVAVLARELVSPPLAMLGAVTVLLVAGVIDAGQAFSGFSNSAPLTVAALYVLAAAVEKTRVLEGVTRRLLVSRGGERGTLARLLAPTGVSSAFLNNTTIVAMVAPSVISWARRTGRSPSPFLLPVSFAAILGGTVTLVGTSTNLVVSGLLEDSGRPGLGLFEIGKVGLPLAVAGLLLLVLIVPLLIPERRAPSEGVGDDVREFTLETLVPERSPLAGRSVVEAELRALEGVFLFAIEREGRTISPVGPDEVLLEGDRLTFVGNVERALDLQERPGLVSAEARHFAAVGAPAERRFFEAVVAPDSPLDGSTLKEVGFRGRYGAAVLGIHRAGERLPGKLGETRLHAGDVLIVLAEDGWGQRWRGRREFLLASPLDGNGPPRREKAPIVAVITVALLALVGFGVLDILPAALMAAFALVGLRVLTPSEARDAVDLNVIVLIAASFGLGAAMSASGLAEEIAALFVGPFGGLGGIGLLVGVLLATTLLTELITNNAAAVLMFPIALAAALQAGFDVRPFAIAVAIGASASFLTPVGYQTNTMVYGIGGYRFGDFARVGLPLTLLMIVVVAVFVPLAWPLVP